MKTSKMIAAKIAAKKALMEQELNSIDLSVGHEGLNVTLYGRSFGRTTEFSAWERNCVRNTVSTRKLANNL